MRTRLTPWRSCLLQRRATILLALAALLGLPAIAQAPATYQLVGVGADGAKRWEPSGAARDSATARILLISDKDDLGSPLFSATWDSAAERLAAPAAVAWPLPPPSGKLEDIAADSAHAGVFYATGSFEGTVEGENRDRFYRLHYSGTALTVQQDSAAVAAIQGLRSLLGKPYIKVEGLAVDPLGKYLFVGLRMTGGSLAEARTTATIYRFNLNGPTASGFFSSPTPALVLQFDPQAAVGRPEALSGLTWDGVARRYLMLTSFEAGPTRDGVGGHLFVLPKAMMEAASPFAGFSPQRLNTDYSHKPEGICVDAAGKLILVYDDDEFRKMQPGETVEQAEAANRFGYPKNMAPYVAQPGGLPLAGAAPSG
jgi:hypothetical protein